MELSTGLISNAQIKGLKAALSFGLNTPMEYRFLRASLAKCYMDLWRMFREKYSTNSQINNVQSRMVATVVRLILFPPFQPAAFESLNQLSTIEPLWTKWLLISLVEGIGNRAKRFQLLTAICHSFLY